MSKHNFSIVLVAPEIPGNTGSIGRTCLALDLDLILIHPLGFDLNEKAVRRAGLDYWKHVTIKEYDNWESFMETEKPESSQLCLFSSGASSPHFAINFPNQHHYLIFGGETAGLPDKIKSHYPQQVYQLPMYSEHIRSLNLSNAVTAVAYEGIRQLKFI